MSVQSVYFFGGGQAEGTRDMKRVLGGKGANLAEMVNLGVPVPPGFTIATDVCVKYLRDGKYPDALREEVDRNLTRLEKVTARTFGEPANPLLVSVRSGAPISMPGMMETILNLGLNDRTVLGLAQQSGNPRFAYDSYRRFIQMYGDVVLGVPFANFEHLLAAKRLTEGAATDADLGEQALRNLVEEYKALVRKQTRADFPMDPRAQLWGAIEAVWRSWTLKKAVDYRRVNRIPEDVGTAVNVVTMVFGNMGDDSGTGVAFTRNPSTVERKFYGECPGGGRGCRHPNAAQHRRDGNPVAWRVRGAAAHPGPARAALPRDAGYRVHRAARTAVPAPDPQRQAHGSRGGAHRHGHG
jgi:pyruvate, orthophosphate dikinase